jgi:hypothetical protein
MTKKEMRKIIEGEKVKTGYCCYQDDGLSKSDLKEIGSNSGAYGWNWTLYYHKASDTYYVSGYRNF